MVVILLMDNLIKQRSLANKIRSRGGYIVLEMIKSREVKGVCEAGLLPDLIYIELKSTCETLLFAKEAKFNLEEISIWIAGDFSIPSLEVDSFDKAFPLQLNIKKLVHEIDKFFRWQV